MKVETERNNTLIDLQKIAIEKAQLLQKADSDDKSRKIDSLFKAAEMEQQDIDKRLEATKNVQNEQQATGAVSASAGVN